MWEGPMSPVQVRETITDAELNEFFTEAQRLSSQVEMPVTFAMGLRGSLYRFPPCPGCGSHISTGSTAPGAHVDWETRAVTFHPCRCRLDIAPTSSTATAS
jgi:hypothetical protein